MLRIVCRGLAMGAALLGAATASAQLAGQIGDQITGGVPIIGANVGAALPISDFRKSADPGGAIAPFIGWQIGDLGGFTITPLLEAQYAGLTEGGSQGDGTPGVVSTGGGARAALNDEHAEVFFGMGGGYYWGTGGAIEDADGGGFNFNGGVNYEFWRGTALGVFARYDQASFAPYPGSTSDDTKFLTTGLSVRHRFLPPPPVPPAPLVAAAPAPPPPMKKKIILRGVNFDFDKSKVRPDAVPILDEAAKTLVGEADVKVAVNGYTDGIGTAAYNQALSERRAGAVKGYLETHGVAASRMTATGFGKTNPVATNETAEGRAQNRRVELLVN